MSEPLSAETDVLRKALELVWHIHVRAHTHLGLERYSGLAGRCIPCICALALGRAFDSDSLTIEALDTELEKVKGERHSHG